MKVILLHAPSHPADRSIPDPITHNGNFYQLVSLGDDDGLGLLMKAEGESDYHVTWITPSLLSDLHLDKICSRLTGLPATVFGSWVESEQSLGAYNQSRRVRLTGDLDAHRDNIYAATLLNSQSIPQFGWMAWDRNQWRENHRRVAQDQEWIGQLDETARATI